MTRFVLMNPFNNEFLQSYDPDEYNGIGIAGWTSDVHKAMIFEDQRAALELWQQQSRVRPLRPDGKPNRPLTAYTIEIRRLDDGPEV